MQKESSSEANLKEIAKKNPHKLKDFVQDEEIQKLVDEYYGLDFEDIIAGNIKTKFKVWLKYCIYIKIKLSIQMLNKKIMAQMTNCCYTQMINC